VATVQQTVESGIIPIVIEPNDVVFFESSERLSRTFLTINSLELGVIGYEQYRVVARRTKQANKLTERHLAKLMRMIPTMVVERPEISCYIVPTYTKLLKSGELTDLLVKALSLYPEAYASRVCIDFSSDVLFDDLDTVKAALNEIRSLGFKIAVSEVGDSFCPAFRLAELPLDYVFLDKSAITRLTSDNDGERIVGSFISYLKGLGARVFAPECYEEEITLALRRAGCDGCVGFMDSGADEPEEYLPEQKTEEKVPEVEATASVTVEIGGDAVDE
jgi:EAL domain-containing protein (putative c-di-GMP-specific phosphodiesterase class I)